MSRLSAVTAKLSLALVAAAAASGLAAAQAPVTFANFSQINPSTQAFSFTPSVGVASFTASVPVNFSFSSTVFGTQLAPALQGTQVALLTVNATTSAAVQDLGALLYQPLTSGTITFTRAHETSPGSGVYVPDAAGVGNGGQTNLLSVSFGSGSSQISGVKDGGTASSTGDSNNGAVTFNSDFLEFDNTTRRQYSLSLTSVNPSLSNTDGNAAFLDSFTASGTGNFASNPPPIYFAAVPEPATVTLMGLMASGAASGLGLRFVRGRRAAKAAV